MKTVDRSVMKNPVSRWFPRTFWLCVPVLLFVVTAAAQTDRDMDSPTPVLLSFNDSTRALAVEGNRFDLKEAARDAFRPGSQVSLLAANITLRDGEGANALRLYVEDSEKHKFSFPVTSIEPYSHPQAPRNTFVITVEMFDQLGLRDSIVEGDLLVGLTWRGVISNRVRLGYGQIGGRIKDDPGSVPTPVDATRIRQTTENKREIVGNDIFSGDRMRFLQQATFGATAALYSRVRKIGIKAWLVEQFEAPYPSKGNPYPNFPLKSNDETHPTAGCGMFASGSAERSRCHRDHYIMYQPSTWFFREALHGDAQLRHRVAWALSQIWVTAATENQQSRHMIEWHRLLSEKAFGNYRSLMKQMTLNPTMGKYLDMKESTRRNPNENYARELMQLFTVGGFLLKQDGTLKRDENGDPIPTYTQKNVTNLSRVLTGWQLCEVASQCPNKISEAPNYIDNMRINNTDNHDVGAKTLLSWHADPAFPSNNTHISACSGNCSGADVGNIRAYAEDSLIAAIDNLFNHPNVGPFVTRRLIQHLVTSDPTPAYVGRVAAVFNDNGSCTRGDLRAVVKAILLDPEARGDKKTEPTYGKLREPVLFATNILRGLDVGSADGGRQTDGYIADTNSNSDLGRPEFNNMGQIPFFSPSVFNFFPPDFQIPGTDVIGPEFALMTTATAIARVNFVHWLVYTRVPIPANPPDSPEGLSVKFDDLEALSKADSTGNLLLDELDKRFLHKTMTDENRATIRKAVTSIDANNSLGRVQQAIYLVSTSSQFQIQR